MSGRRRTRSASRRMKSRSLPPARRRPRAPAAAPPARGAPSPRSSVPRGEHEHAGVPEMPPAGDQLGGGRRRPASRRSGRARARRARPASSGADLDIAVAGLRRGRVHAEGDDPAGARGRHGAPAAPPCSASGVGDRRRRRPSSTAPRPGRARPPAGRRRRWPGRCCGRPAPARCARRRCRPRASARRSGTGAPGCRRRPAAAKPGPTPRSAVSCSMVRSETSGQSCLGKLSRETGHSRVPEPPDRMTGTMVWAGLTR